MKAIWLLVFLAWNALGLSSVVSAQSSSSWATIKQDALEVQIPPHMLTNKGRMPAHLEHMLFYLNYISAKHPTQRFFTAAGYGILPLPAASDDQLEQLSEQYIQQFFGPLSIPFVGDFRCDPNSGEVSKYDSNGEVVKEVIATSLHTNQTYDLFFMFALHRIGLYTLMSYAIAGCPEDEIDGYDRIMSVFLASFTLRLH